MVGRGTRVIDARVEVGFGLSVMGRMLTFVSELELEGCLELLERCELVAAADLVDEVELGVGELELVFPDVSLLVLCVY